MSPLTSEPRIRRARSCRAVQRALDRFPLATPVGAVPFPLRRHLEACLRCRAVHALVALAIRTFRPDPPPPADAPFWEEMARRRVLAVQTADAERRAGLGKRAAARKNIQATGS